MLHIAPIGGRKWEQKEQRLYVGQLPLILVKTVVVKEKKCIPVLSINLT